MESISEYKHLEMVQDFVDSSIYRAQNISNGRAVLIKIFKKEHTRPLFERVEGQMQRIRHFDFYLIQHPLRAFSVENRIAMSWEDRGAMFLSVILKHYQREMELFFDIAIRITQSLGELHTGQLLHNDLRPHNILLNERTGEVLFTGLSFSEQRVANTEKILAETLGEDPYIYTAPEQTGRINWEIDQKSDLYALGVVFYEMLAGRTPFQEISAQKMIQSHLVVEPESICTFFPECPKALDQIIMKLLSKGPEDRYQSSFGLQKDLEACRQQFQSTGEITPFELGQKDNIERLVIPTKLYGSQESFITLIESFNCVITGSVEMTLVEGNAGMGKTSLISELLNLASQKNAYIGSGRCEREYRDTPYYSIIKAFQMLVRDILQEDHQRLDSWKEKFLGALGKNGQLVIDFIPEVELIIGKQPPVPKLDADESQNRLNHIFRRFIQTFTQEGQPLVIFLDSFQWADLASMQLIQAALSDLGSRYILLVVAYQKHLIRRSHTFSVALDEIKRSGVTINRINVTALNLLDVCQIIEDSFSFKQDFKRLAQHILEVTGGNPYFVKQYLSTIYERRLILFDPKEGRWVWDIGAIKRAKIPNNVVALMAEKVKDLPPESMNLLKLASCIGSQFDLETLRLSTTKDKRTLLAHLQEPIERGLIKPVGPEAIQAEILGSQRSKKKRKKHEVFQFTHSRAQAAAYSLLKARERKSNHLKLGRLLLTSHSKKEIDQHAYQIVNQMNQGMQLIRKPAERYELARLNLIAGQKSKAAAAFETAWKYYSIGSQLLPPESWEDNYELTKELYLKRSQCEYFIGNAEAAEPIFDSLLENVRTKREKVDVIDLKLNLYIKNNRLDDAITLGLSAMSEIFHEEIPPNNAEITIISQMKMQEIQVDLEQRKIETLLYLPEMVDEDKKALLDLITNIIPAAYIARRNLWIMLTLRMVELSLESGNAASSAFGYMNYAVILCSGLQDYNNGYAIGQLALDLNNRFERVSLSSQLNFLFGSYIGHWRKKAVDNFKYLKRSYQTGIEFGDYISAALSVDSLMKGQIIVGTPLEEIQREVKKHQDFVDQFNNPDLANILRISELMLLLKDPGNVTTTPHLEPLESKELLQSLENSLNTQLKQWYYLVSAQINYLYYNFETALDLIQKSDHLIASYSQLAVAEHYFYYSLIIIANYDRFSNENKKRYWDVAKNNQAKLSTMANGCPINFREKEVLISALMAGISGNYIKAGDLFDESIQLALENGFLQNEAIANELTAKYYLSKGKITIATAYLRKACLAYIKWGAMAKLKHLEQSYPQLLKQRQRFDDLSDFEEEQSEEHASLFSDVSSIMVKSQEIAEESDLESMVGSFLKTVVSQTDSQKGFYLIERHNQIKIIAEAVKEKEVAVKQLSAYLEEFDSIAHSVVFYVIRTRQQVLLDDASKDSTFAYNKYIKENSPKSIFCTPIVNRDKLQGILYLENAQVVRAFPPKLIDMVNLFISQVSISIENAILKNNIDHLGEELEASKRKYEKRIQLLELELQSGIS